MATTYLIRIGILTPSQNVLARKFKSPFAYKRLRDTLETWLMVGRVNNRIPKATQRRRLTITRYAKTEHHLLDRGNFVGGCKPLLDAAIRQGLIIDDKEVHLDDIYEQRVDRRDPRTEVRIDEI